MTFKKREKVHTTNVPVKTLEWPRKFIAQAAAASIIMTTLSGPIHAQEITADGRTATNIVTNGNVTDITTNTIRGANAFNSFGKFTVDSGNLVNLFLPGGANNLLNVVKTPTSINGMVNSIKNGAIGGNVYFVTPGFIVGSSGVLNFGSLKVVTPSKSVIDNFFTTNGEPAADAVGMVMDGTVPIDDSGLISVKGKINTTGAVSLAAGNVVNAGTIVTGAVFQTSKPDFSDVVNTNNIESGSKIVTENGSISIVATNDVENSGTIAANGGNNLNAADINISAGHDITLADKSVIAANGVGENSSGGNVKVIAGNNANLQAGAVIETHGGKSGDAGNIEFSAAKTATIAGSFNAAAANGKAGTVTIDPTDIVVESSQYQDGADYIYSATDSITIADGVTISTRKTASSSDNQETAASIGDSGDISLTAQTVTIGAGSKLITQVINDGTTYSAGDITLTGETISLAGGSKLLARNKLAGSTDKGVGGTVTLKAESTGTDEAAGLKTAEALITIGDTTDGATIEGGKVDITAKATAENKSNLSSTTLATSKLSDDLGNVEAVTSSATATAKIDIKNDSSITADNKVTLTAATETVAGAGSSKLASASGNSLGILYAGVTNTASVTLSDAAQITAADLAIAAHNNAALDASITAAPAANSGNQKWSVALGVTNAAVNATADIKGDLHVTGGVQIAATNEGSYSTKVTSKTGSNGEAGGAVAIAIRNSSATASLTGDVDNAASVGVYAVNHIAADTVSSSTTTGTSATTNATTSAASGLEGKLATKLGLDSKGLDSKLSTEAKDAGLTQQSFRVAGAISYADNTDKASATIGGGTAAQTVTATGAVAVGSQIKNDSINIAASSTAKSESSVDPSGSTGNTSRQSYSVGLAIGNYNQNALAEIGKNVTVKAGKVGVEAKTLIPIKSNIFTKALPLSSIANITDDLKALKDTISIFNGTASSSATADNSDGSIAVSGSALLLGFNNTSQAIVDNGATIELTGTSTGAWSSDTVTVNEGSEAKTVTIGGQTYTYKNAQNQEKVTFDFSSQTDIHAVNDTTLLFLGGKLITSTNSEYGLGAALNDISVNSTVNAIVREGASIKSAKEITVNSIDNDNVINVATLSGKGSTFGLSGSIAIANVNQHSRALIDDEAMISADSLALHAVSTPVVWSAGGGINLSSGASVGVGLAVNNVSTDNEAEIADNDTLSTDGSPRVSQATITKYSLSNPTGAKISVPNLSVNANTYGIIGSISVTGAISNNKDETTDDKDKTDTGVLGKIKGAYSTVKGLPDKISGLKKSTVTKPDKTAVAKPESPSIGLSGAGSASINLTKQINKAEIDNVYIDQTGSSKSLTVRGTAATDVLAASGAAAITRANNKSQTTEVGMAGSVAANILGNGNSATISNSTVVNGDGVTVQALTSGQDVAAALGMAVSATTSQTDFSATGYGSVSLTLQGTVKDDDGNTLDFTKATVDNSNIKGKALEVTAYNSTSVGTGAGALEVQPTGQDSTGASAGVAFTMASLSSHVTGTVSDSDIDMTDKIDVNALNASKIAAAGATGSVTNNANKPSVAATVVIMDVDNHTTAEVDSSTLDAVNAVNVKAADQGRDSTYQALIKASSTEYFNFDGLNDIFAKDADGILAVAGTVNVGKGANVGVSVEFSQISDKVAANVTDSTLKATGKGGTVGVNADTDAVIAGLAVGVGVSKDSLSGAGSVAAGFIDNSVKVSVSGTSTLSADTVDLKVNDKSKIMTLAGQANVSVNDGMAIGAALTLNDISDTASVTVDAAEIDGKYVTISGDNNSEIDTIAASGAVAAHSSALAGSLTFNFISDTTEAVVQNGATINLTGSDATLKVLATDASTLRSLAGAVSIGGGSAAAGGAFAYNSIDNTNNALVDSSTITDAVTATVDVTATEDATIQTLAAAVGGSQDAALAGSMTISLIGGWTGESTTAKLNNVTLSGGSSDVNVTAADTSNIYSASGGLAVSTGGAAVGAASSVNSVAGTTTALVSGSKLSELSGLDVHGNNTAEIKSVAAAGSIASEVAGSGSISSNTVINKTYAGISGTTSDKITAKTANVTVDADNTGTIYTAAGSIGISGSAAMGVAASTNAINNITDAYITGAKVDAKNISITGTTGGTIDSLAFGFAGSGDVSVAGSGAFNYIGNTTDAYINGSADVDTEGTDDASTGVKVQADNTSKINTATGGAAASGSVGVGLAASVNIITDKTYAKVSGANVTSAKDVLIKGSDSATINSAAVGFAGSGAASVSGSAASNTIANETKAYIDTGANVEADGTTAKSTGVTVEADNTGAINTLSGGAAVSGSVGAGVAVSVNVINNETDAYVSGAKATSKKNVVVKGVTGGSIKSAAVALGGGGDVGVGGSTATNYIGSNTSAYITNGATVTADDNVGVIAETDDSVTNLAGAAGIGVAAAGVGASVTVNLITGNTSAYISGDDTHKTVVTAYANDAADTLTVNDGTLTKSVTMADAIKSFGRADIASLEKTQKVTGVAVSSTATHSLENVVATIGAGLYAGVSGSVNFGLLEGQTTAKINSAQVNSDTNINVLAGDHAYSNSMMGTVGIGAAGVGLGIDTNVFSGTTEASVTTAKLSSGADTNLNAETTQGASTLVASGAGGLVGVAGSGAVDIFASKTNAFISDSDDVKITGKLNVKADHKAYFFAAAGTASIGGVAAAGSFAVVSDAATTQAYLDGSTIDADGAIDVEASNTDTITNTGISGAGGASGTMAGSIAVTAVNNSTSAYVTGSNISGKAKDKANSLTVKANDTVNVTNTAGAVGVDISNVGAGGGAGVVEVGDTTQAYIGDSSVYADAVTVEADAQRDLTNTSVNAGAGAIAGINGSIAVTLVGVDFKDASDTGDIKSTLSDLNSQTGGNRLSSGNIKVGSDTSSGISDANYNKLNAAGKLSVSDKLNKADLSTTAKVYGDTDIHSTGEVKVSASDTDSAKVIVGGAAGGLFAGVGGSVGVLVVNHNVEASVIGTDIGTPTVDTNGAVTVSANVSDLKDYGASTESYQGGGGLVGLGAAVADANVTDTVTAKIGRGVTVTGATTVQATDSSTVNTTAKGFTGGLAAAGIVVANSDKSGDTQALVSDNNNSDTVTTLNGAVTVKTERTGSVSAHSLAGGGGVYAGSGSATHAKDSGSSKAKIGDDVKITAGSNAVWVSALAKPQTWAKSEGYGGGLYAYVGGTLSLADAEVAIEASLGEDDTVTAGSLTLSAQALTNGSNNTAYSYGQAVGGGAIGLAANVSEAKSSSDVDAFIGKRGQITISGATSVGATNNTSQKAEVTGIVGGLAAIGVNTAKATSSSTTDAYLADDVKKTTNDTKKIVSGSVSISAQGTDDNYAETTAGVGGVIAGSAAVVQTNTGGSTTAYIGKNALIETGSMNLTAEHNAYYNGKINSISASLVGASGAAVTHAVNSTVKADIRDSADISAGGDVVISSSNVSKQDWLGADWNISAASGGLLGGAAVASVSTINETTEINIGEGAKVTAGDKAMRNKKLGLSQTGSVTADVYSNIVAHEKAKINAGGAISAALAATYITAGSDNNLNIGEGAFISSEGAGAVKLGTRSDADLDNQVAVDVYGVAGAPAGIAHSTYTGTNDIDVGLLAGISTDQNDIWLAAGRDTKGNKGVMSANSTVNLWNHTAIPINTKPDPESTIHSTSNIKVHGGTVDSVVKDAFIGSAQDISLIADKGSLSATYTGIGKDIYREALAEIAGWFGAKPNFDIHGGSASTGGSSTVTVDGRVATGTQKDQYLTLNGKYVSTDGKSFTWVSNNTASDGVTWTDDGTVSVSDLMFKRLDNLYKLRASYAGDAIACGAYDAEIKFLQNKMVDMGLAIRDADGNFMPTSSGSWSPRATAQQLHDDLKAISDTAALKDAAKKTADDNYDLINTRDTTKSTWETKKSDLGTYCTAAGDANMTKDQAAAKYASTHEQKYQDVVDAYDAVALAKGNYDAAAKAVTDAGLDSLTLSAAQTAKTNADGEASYWDAQAAKSKATLDTLTPDYISKLAETASGQTAPAVTVNNITAKLGNIKITADNLTGTGKLEAPGNATININNYSPAFLDVKDLSIRNGGSILFNGATVNSNADINQYNLNKSGASFSTIQTKNNTAAPVINVKSWFEPSSAKYCTVYDGLGQAIADVKAVPAAPDLTLSGNITNLYGKVSIFSQAGSIYSKGSIVAKEVSINANNGDFVQSYVNGFDNIGGDPATTDPTKPGHIVANGNICISARYLNINGLIQSGVDTRTLTLSANPTFTASKDQLGLSADGTQTTAYGKVTYNDTTGVYEVDMNYIKNYWASGNCSEANGLFTLKVDDPDDNIATGENISATYNASAKRFEVDALEVHGGYVQLYGQIMNTALNGATSGKVRALDGYGTFTITNDSGQDIYIQKMDTGTGAAGVIDIIDVRDNSGVIQKTETVYTSNRGTLTKTVNGVDTAVGTTTTATMADGSQRTNTTYLGQGDQYYNWTSGQDSSKTEYFHYEQEDVFGISYNKFLTVNGSLTKVTYGETVILPNGNYVTTSKPVITGADIIGETDYMKLQKVTYNSGVPERNKIREWTHRDWWSLGIHGTYYLDYSVTTPQKTIYTSTVKASNPIGIEFFGSDTGHIQVTGNSGNIILSNAINNKMGTTTLTTTKNIIQDVDSALITTKNLNLTAANIGTSANLVRTVTSGTINATASTGDIYLQQVLGNANLGVVQADNGMLTISADGDIVNDPGTSVVRANRIDLTSTNGSIGTTDTPLVMSTGETTSYLNADRVQYGLKASALDEINIENKAWTGKNADGNLMIDTVVSTTGDVKLKTPGKMVDNNIDEQIDTRTWDKLTSYWDSMQLRAGTKENDAKQTQTINSYVSGKMSDYQVYWQLKSRIVNGKYTCTAAERAALEDQKKDVAAFEASQTTKYQQLATEGVGSWNNGTFSADFVYTPTDAEKQTLLSGSSWTDKELAVSLSLGTLKELTDTNPVIKAPNVKGKNVTLNAGKGIGTNIVLPDIDLSKDAKDFTAEEKVALAAAERQDLQFVNNIVKITQRKPVNFQLGSDGLLNVTSGGYAYLGSEDSVLIDNITANGDVRLKVGGSIAGKDALAAVITGQNVVLEAATGGIGSDNKQLVLEADGTLTGRAAKGIYIKENGDMDVDSIYSEQGIDLEATGAIKAHYSDGLNTKSSSLILQADEIGAGDNAFRTFITDNGTITADAQDDIYLSDSGDTLNVNYINSKAGNLKIASLYGSILNAAVDANKANFSGKNIELAASIGDIGTTAKRVTVDPTGTLKVTAKNVNMSAMGTDALHIDEANVAQSMNLRADSIFLDDVKHTGSTMLTLDLSGATKPMADKVTVNVASNVGVTFANLTADVANINGDTNVLNLENTNIGSRADIYNKRYHVVVDNVDKQLFTSDLQLIPRQDSFYLRMTDKPTILTDSQIMNYNPDLIINEQSTENSVVLLAQKATAHSQPDGGQHLFGLPPAPNGQPLLSESGDLVVFDPQSLGMPGNETDSNDENM